jgi:mycofactocin precursor
MDDNTALIEDAPEVREVSEVPEVPEIPEITVEEDSLVEDVSIDGMCGVY